MTNLTDDRLPSAVKHLEVELSVRLGTSELTLREISALQAGSTIMLRESADQPLELCANGRVIARGELEECDDREGFALRITETSGPRS